MNPLVIALAFWAAGVRVAAACSMAPPYLIGR